MTQQQHRIVAPDQMRAFYWAMLGAVGVPRPDAEIVARCLLLADLRGVDSHGILHLGGYMRAIRDGWIKARPDIRLIHETPTTAVCSPNCSRTARWLWVPSGPRKATRSGFSRDRVAEMISRKTGPRPASGNGPGVAARSRATRPRPLP